MGSSYAKLVGSAVTVMVLRTRSLTFIRILWPLRRIFDDVHRLLKTIGRYEHEKWRRVTVTDGRWACVFLLLCVRVLPEVGVGLEDPFVITELMVTSVGRQRKEWNDGGVLTYLANSKDFACRMGSK